MAMLCPQCQRAMKSELFAAVHGSGHVEIHRCETCQGSWVQPPSDTSGRPDASSDEAAALGIEEERMAQRLQELEIKLAYQDDLVETLNQVVIELRGEVTALERNFKTLRQQVSETLPDDAPAHDPPPHY